MRDKFTVKDGEARLVTSINLPPESLRPVIVARERFLSHCKRLGIMPVGELVFRREEYDVVKYAHLVCIESRVRIPIWRKSETH